MTARPRQTGMIEAILIALVLVVQTFGSAYAAGADNRALLLDAFGNPLCITSGEHGDAGDGTKHGGLKDCCALACASVAAISAPPDAARAEPPAARLIGTLTGRAFIGLITAGSFSPANPRAPPSV